MTDMSETLTTSGLLERTPQIEPFYGEVKSAIHQLHNGDVSSGPVWKIVHGLVGANEKKGILGSEWHRYPVTGGVIIPHRDFLSIQDEFSVLERDKDYNIPWNAKQSIEAMGAYIRAGKQYRARHVNFFQQSLNFLNSHQRSKVQKFLHSHDNLTDAAEDITLVALPSHLDNPHLWESLNLNGELLKRIPLWAKISEHGVILASRLHRNDNPRGHDLFSHNAKAVRTGEEHDMLAVMTHKAQHEYSHGPSDAILIDLLNLNTQTPVYEGLAGALGEDGREKKPSPSFSDLLTTPYPRDVEIRKNTAYYAGTKYWEALRRLLLSKGNANPWPALIGAALSSASDINDNQEIIVGDENARMSHFLRDVPRRLGIDMTEVERAFASLETS